MRISPMLTRKLYKPHFRIMTFLYHTGTSKKLRQSSSPRWLDLVQYIGKKNKATKFLEKHLISVDLYQLFTDIICMSKSSPGLEIIKTELHFKLYPLVTDLVVLSETFCGSGPALAHQRCIQA